MRYLVDLDKPSIEELAHFGVKGMKWGVIREKLAESSAARERNRQLNKEFRKGEKAERKKETAEVDSRIDQARAHFKSGQARRDYKAAKAQYKIDKKEIGTAAARAKFQKVKDHNWNEKQIADVAKSGKETTLVVLGLVGLTALRVGMAVAGARR